MNGQIRPVACRIPPEPAKRPLVSAIDSFFCNSTLAFFLLNQDMPNDFFLQTRQPQTFACDFCGNPAPRFRAGDVLDGAGQALEAALNEYFPELIHTAPDWQASCCMNSEVLDGSLLPQTFAN